MSPGEIALITSENLITASDNLPCERVGGQLRGQVAVVEFDMKKKKSRLHLLEKVFRAKNLDKNKAMKQEPERRRLS